MSWYSQYILPTLIHKACQSNEVETQRKKIVPFVHGSVLEIGIGSGLNLPFYNSNHVNHIFAVDPSIELWEKSDLRTNTIPVDYIQASAESIPLDSNSIDSILITFTMCSISNIEMALQESRRVLKSSGKVYFCEHGLSPDYAIAKWQDRLTPLWKRIGGGCHLNRDMPILFEKNRFKLEHLEQSYIPGWKPASYHYLGIAKPT